LRNMGGILQLKRRCYAVDFQRAMRKLFLASVDSKNLPQTLRRAANAEVRALRKHIRKTKRVEHSFFRLGLRTTELTSIERETEEPTECIGPYNFYAEFYSIRTGLSTKHIFFPLIGCLLSFHELKQFTLVRQTRFKTCTPSPDLVPKAKKCTDSSPLRVKVYLVAMEIALSKFRYHCVVGLAMSLLLDRKIDQVETRHFKVYVYEALAIALAHFNAPLDLVFAILSKIKNCAIYPSDNLTFDLAKQKILAAYGMSSKETLLFEKLHRQETVLPQSVYLKQLLSVHCLSVFRRCLAWVLEVWCAQSESLGVMSKELSQKINQIFSKIHHRLSRLSEVLTPFRESPNVFRGTIRIVRMMDARIKMVKGILAYQTGNRVKANQTFYELSRDVTGIYGSLFAAFYSPEQRADHLWACEMGVQSFVDELTGETDFTNHPKIGIKSFEILSVTLGLGMGHEAVSLVNLLVRKSRVAFGLVSEHQNHWCLALICRVQKVLNQEQSRKSKSAIGLCNRQLTDILTSASKKASRTGGLEAGLLEDPHLFSFFDTRDRFYLSQLASFGLQSLHLRKGVGSVYQ